MALPTGSQGPSVSIPSVDGLSAVGTQANPFYISQAGAQFREVGPFSVAACAATQTAAATVFGASGMGLVAKRAGHATGFSAELSAAITGAGTTITAKLYKNGVLVNAALNLTFTQAGGEVKLYVTVDPTLYAFAAGDVLTVVYDSTGITNTPALVATIEVQE